MSNEVPTHSNLSHYRMISKIGAGGMGEVYLAEDTKLGRKVALKLLTEKVSDDDEKLKRFIREAQTASSLNHPNILTVYEIGEADGRNFIVTELIEGMTLRERLARHGALSPKEALRVGIQVTEALAAAHRAGVIHRDIKPENIMIRSDGYAKVLDFGLAKLVEQDRPPSGGGSFETQPGIVMGTVAYMSPEQARGQHLDGRSDIFSLGSVFYEMLAGRQAFHGETQSHALVAILEKDPEPLPSLSSALDDELARITAKALAKSPDDRYLKAEQLLDDLQGLAKHIELSAGLGAVEARTEILTVKPTPPGNTIAVLPFVNMSRDENGDYFSDGIAEELLNVLSKIRGLRVAARTSAFVFKGKTATITEIGNALNVASVLEGSIRMAGDQVRIAVQLIEVATGYRLWSDSYDRRMDDIFAIQDDIAQSVVGELRVRLLGESPGKETTKKVMDEIAVAVRGRADDPEAQRLMLLGRHFLDLTTRQDIEKAIGYFKEAVELDPAYALGWAELARAYAVQAGKAWFPVEEGYALSRDATEQALKLEPELAEAYAQLGRVQSAYEIDMLGSKASYERALELAPGSPLVMDGASILELKFGHFERALDLSRRVLEQDPLSGAMWHNLGLICHASGLFQEAEDALRRALELSPNRTVTAAMLALAILDRGEVARALEATEHEPDGFWKLWARCMILFADGKIDLADAALEELIRDHSAGDAYQIAEVYAFRGETDLAFEWLDRSLDEHDPGITHAGSSPRLRGLRGDARWPSFMEKIGLPFR